MRKGHCLIEIILSGLLLTIALESFFMSFAFGIKVNQEVDLEVNAMITGEEQLRKLSKNIVLHKYKLSEFPKEVQTDDGFMCCFSIRILNGQDYYANINGQRTFMKIENNESCQLVEIKEIVKTFEKKQIFEMNCLKVVNKDEI